MYFFILVLALLLIFIVYKYYKYREYESYIQDYTPQKISDTFVNLNYENILKGKAILKTKKIVICGLMRDCAPNISFIQEYINKLSVVCADYKVLIVENDSTDDTRKLLLEWSKQNDKVIILGCGINKDECKLNLYKTQGHEANNERIKKMADLRNIYIDYISKNLSTYDYMFVMDMDLYGSWYLDGLMSSIALLEVDNNLDALAAFGLSIKSDNYYDPFALRFKDMKNNFETIEEKYEWDDKIFSIKSKEWLSKYKNLLPVKSAFGGLCIYKIASVISKNSKYDYPKDGKISCEHVYFNEGLNMSINMDMIFIMLSNPTYFGYLL